MGLFKRFRDLTVSTINDLIDKAEDPVKLLNQYLRDMEQDIADAEGGVAKQIAIEKKFKQQYAEMQEMAEKREQQAIKALEAGDEELARRALVDKKEYQQKAQELEGQYNNAKSNADQLRGQLKEMKDEFAKLKNKKETLIARAEAAKAQKSINQAMSGFGKDNAAKGFERMNEKVLQMEAEAEASKELSSTDRTLDDELAELDKNNDVEDDLAALKARINKKTTE